MKQLVLDGAMGTLLRAVGETGLCDRLVLDKPELIADIHRQYRTAGADIITTNTFNATSVELHCYGAAKLATDINTNAVRIARSAASDALIAGSVGPTRFGLSKSNEVSYSQLFDSYAEQIRALIEAGVDFLLIESCYDIINAEAALSAARSVDHDIPIIASAAVVPSSGRLYSGHSLEQLIELAGRFSPSYLGINCSSTPEAILPHYRRLAAASPYPTLFAPNAGHPATLSPQAFAAQMQGVQANIIGGCCGTTPKHIEMIKDAR